jgi:exopolyphosphatase/guanosine-5'-triphosphate,3'-diphosphate pyrophosphatase
MRVAGFDIGSNTLLVLAAEVAGDGSLTAIADECRFGRLGQGLDASGALAPEAIERSLAILGEYRQRLEGLGIDRVGAVGTQALREASNAAAFLEPAAALIGAPIEVISGEREAELVFRATAAAFREIDPSPKAHRYRGPLVGELAAGVLVIADVGGGSTEITVGRDGVLERAISIPIGAVRLTERHLAGDPPTAGETRALIAAIDEALAAVDELDVPKGISLVGTAGTATTFASVELRLARYDGSRVQGVRLSPAQLDRHLARFLELTVAEKRKLVGLEPERADVIAGGAAIYTRLVHRLEASELIVSERGVRWGLAAELAKPR